MFGQSLFQSQYTIRQTRGNLLPPVRLTISARTDSEFGRWPIEFISRPVADRLRERNRRQHRTRTDQHTAAHRSRRATSARWCQRLPTHRRAPFEGQRRSDNNSRRARGRLHRCKRVGKRTRNGRRWALGFTRIYPAPELAAPLLRILGRTVSGKPSALRVCVPKAKQLQECHRHGEIRLKRSIVKRMDELLFDDIQTLESCTRGWSTQAIAGKCAREEK